MFLGLLALLLLPPAAAVDELVLTGVHVVPVDGEPVLRDHAVVVRDGVIAWVGPAQSLTASADATVVDGGGGYLIPGLTDAHVHVRHEDELLLYVANGVTTVLNLSGDPSHLELRERVRTGALLGPRILTAGRTIDGKPPRNPIFEPLGSPEEAEAVVRAQKEAGYDFVKVYDLLSLDAYFAIVEAAEAHGLPVVGHIPKAVGLEGVLEGHALIAHAEEYFYTFFGNEADESRIAEAARLTAESGVAVCPNVGFLQAILDQAHDIEAVLARPEVRYVHPEAFESWRPENNRYVGREASWVRRNETMVPFLVKLTKALHDAGVPLLTGTDASIPGGVPGFALHGELRQLTGVGISPHDALRTVTANPGDWCARHLGTPPFGRVAPGQRADLVLLAANPLEDLEALRTIRGIVLAGRWLEHAPLARRLEELAASYGR